MKILVLEDDAKKKDNVLQQIKLACPDVRVETVSNFVAYTKKISVEKFDLIIVDLVVPTFSDDDPAMDMTDQIVINSRDLECPNFRTPMVALTSFDEKAEENFKDLNLKDITIVTFDEEHGNWKESIRGKVASCIPPINYEFVILCALPKEADAFMHAGYAVGERRVVNGLTCRELQVGTRIGVIVTAPRMGLVSAAVTSAQAIEIFKPRLICMSGISAGVHGKAKIYDVVIPDICHQNDAGKWTDNGFELEPYSVQLEHALKLEIEKIIADGSYKSAVSAGIVLQRDEFPEGTNSLEFSVYCAPASSGSAVVAEEGLAASLKSQHRKLSAFEMEAFALYEASRLSVSKPLFFSAKAVVDNGTASKGDDYHRVACVLSARAVYELLSRGVLSQ
ncbi:MAG: putative nucleoside phosphorylase family [Massilia sp.]|nr:putative nucleoside phosphorylase family [Massilia sp.]